MEIPRRPFQHGQQVRIISGPFSHFDAIFEGYLSGSKRLRFLSLPSRDAACAWSRTRQASQPSGQLFSGPFGPTRRWGFTISI